MRSAPSKELSCPFTRRTNDRHFTGGTLATLSSSLFLNVLGVASLIYMRSLP